MRGYFVRWPRTAPSPSGRTFTAVSWLGQMAGASRSRRPANGGSWACPNAAIPITIEATQSPGSRAPKQGDVRSYDRAFHHRAGTAAPRSHGSAVGDPVRPGAFGQDGS